MSPSGELLFVILAAANHDPATVRESRYLRCRRARRMITSHSVKGIHFCLGANLARMEGAIAISSMLKCLPNLRLSDPEAKLEYRGSYLLRGLKTLPMTVS